MKQQADRRTQRAKAEKEVTQNKRAIEQDGEVKL